MGWYFEGSNFVVKDMRSVFNKIVSSGFPYNWKGKKGGWVRYRMGPRTITHVVKHQTAGSAVTRGSKGAENTARFLTRNPIFQCPDGHRFEGSPAWPRTTCPKCGKPGRNLLYGRGYPKMSYHIYVPYAPLSSEKGKAIIYLCVDPMETSIHAGRGNSGGIGIAYQGHFAGRHHKLYRVPAGQEGYHPSDAQKIVCEPIWREWLKPAYQLKDENLNGHFDWGKAACPGDWIENRIRLIRGEEPLPGFEDDKVPEYVFMSSELFDTHEERQAALVLLGYDLGPYGPHKNGVDGDWGGSSRSALHGFEEDAGITTNGYWDEDTEKAMIRVFKENSLTAQHIAAVIRGEKPLAERPLVAPAGATPVVSDPALESPPEDEDTSSGSSEDKTEPEIPEPSDTEEETSDSGEDTSVEQIDDPEDPPDHPPSGAGVTNGPGGSSKSRRRGRDRRSRSRKDITATPKKKS